MAYILKEIVNFSFGKEVLQFFLKIWGLDRGWEQQRLFLYIFKITMILYRNKGLVLNQSPVAFSLQDHEWTLCSGDSFILLSWRPVPSWMLKCIYCTFLRYCAPMIWMLILQARKTAWQFKQTGEDFIQTGDLVAYLVLLLMGNI